MKKEDIVAAFWFGAVLCFTIGCIMIKTVKCKESKVQTINVKQTNIKYKEGFNSVPKELLP